MTATIALLRGVNVTGNNMVSMQLLREICVSARLRDPQTYIQSGNVVFRSSETDLAKLCARLESAIEKRCGFRPSVMLRTVPEMREVFARCPFGADHGLHPSKLIVYFLNELPTKEVLDRISAVRVGPEDIRPRGREIYVHFPDGQGKSKLPAALDRALKMPATARNWNTVAKLLAMAEAL